MTALEIFNMTMDLIDERLETGVINDADTVAYKVKAPSILTIGQYELGRIADKYGTITYDTEKPFIVSDMAQDLTIDDSSVAQLLPYFLAAHLMIEEKDDIANFYNERYEQLKQEFKKSPPATEEDITDVYAEVVTEWPE